MTLKLQSGLSAVLAAAIAICPLAAEAQQADQGQSSTQTQPSQSNPPAQDSQAGTQSNPPAAQGTQPNPTPGPLEPVQPTEQQNEPPSGPQPQQNAPAPLKPGQTQNQTEPLGTATAPGVSTVGGGASKPAGTAIAPAKQRQYRSLFIKLGLIAGVGVAAGTVYALSRGTSSVPPGSGR